MTSIVVKENIISILNDLGYFIEDDNDVNLQEYIVDSIQFITFIVAVEELFEIEVPEQMLMYESILSLNGFSESISDIISNK